MYRTLIAVLIVSASVWIWATIALYRMRAEDRAYYEAMAPRIEAWKKRSEEALRAYKEQANGTMSPVPLIEPLDFSVVKESAERDARHFSYRSKQSYGEMGFLNGAVLLALAVMVDQQLRRRRREAPDRPADADAGKLVGELVQLNREFIAKSPDGAGAPFVQIDGRRAIVAFHNLAFVSAFVGNPILPMVELPFPEILSAIQDYSKGHSFLTVRTTRGKVVLHDSLHPFQTLADVLSDIVELNRTSPEAYAAALAREPKIHTPWYGWLIFATAVGSILYLGWKFMHQ